MPGSTLHEHPDAGRDGLRRVLVDGAPVLTVARAGALHPLDGSLASCSAPGASACTRRSTARCSAPPLDRARAAAGARRRAGGVGQRRDLPPLGHRARRGVLGGRRLRARLRGAAPRALPQGARRARAGAGRAAAHPRRLDLGRARARARARARRRRRDRRATSRPTTSPRARSRAPTRSTCRRPRSTTTRSGCRGRSSWPATRADPRSAAIELEIHRDGERDLRRRDLGRAR